MLGEAMLNGSGTFLREAIRLLTLIAAPQKSRSRMEEGCESLASQPCWTALSSKR